MLARPLPSGGITVSVGDIYQDVVVKDVPIASGMVNRIPLGAFQAGDIVVITPALFSDAGQYRLDVLHADDAPAFAAAHAPGLGFDNGLGPALSHPLVPIQIQIQRDGLHELLVRNVSRWRDSLGMRLSVLTQHKLGTAEKIQLAGELRNWGDEIERTFVIPSPLELVLAPCGQANAFALGSRITICTEIRSLFAQHGWMLDGIFYHETGHVLLRMFGFPGWDREAIPDDFAVFMAFQRPQTYAILEDLIAHNLSGDFKAEMEAARLGDQHAVGPQRAAHVRDRLRNPAEWAENWNGKIYPYMQTAHLLRVARSPRGFESQQIAKRVLAQRGIAVP